MESKKHQIEIPARFHNNFIEISLLFRQRWDLRLRADTGRGFALVKKLGYGENLP